jgi:hypothetical protein
MALKVNLNHILQQCFRCNCFSKHDGKYLRELLQYRAVKYMSLYLFENNI